MSENYVVSPEMLTTVDYKILILTLPTTELEDLLTHLVAERGKISKSAYEDFLIANCIGNLNQFMAHIRALTNPVTATENVDLTKLRQEVTLLILKHNPLLEPSNIVINSNKVLKLKSEKDKDVILLTENIYWSKSYYDQNGNYKPTPNDEVNHMRKQKAPNSDKAKKDIKDLEWEAAPVFWDRLNEYISVKKFSLEAVDQLLIQKHFHNVTSFNTYIVSSCIVNVEEVYERIEGMGVNVDPNKVIRELFQLCVAINETISYTRAKDLQPSSAEELEDDGVVSPAQTAQSNKWQGTKKKKKSKATFKQVPKSELLQLSTNMKTALIGQDDAVEQLTEAIKRASVGLKDPIKPIGSFLFAGRTGCGKSLASKILADQLIRTPKNRVIIDCSEYSSDHEYAKLIGSPNGYIGHDSGGVLTNAVAEDPFSVVVFDEIEKASTKVYDLLLQILDEGRLTDGKGQTVTFKDTIVILTSNIGVKEVDEVSKTIGFGDVAVLTEEKKNSALDSALKKKFKPEFLNRLDSIIHFKDLSTEDYIKIIDIELNKLVENLKLNDTEYKNIHLTFDKKIKQFIFEHGVDSKFGARPIKRAIEKYVANEIASLLLEEGYSPYVTINVTTKKNKVVLIPTEREKEPQLFLYNEGSK